MNRAQAAAGLVALGLVVAQATTGLVTMLRDASSASLTERRRAITAPAEERLDAALGEAAPLYRALEAELSIERTAPHAVVYLYPTGGLPTDLDQLARLQTTWGTPLAALVQPAATRLLGPDLSLGELDGDELLLLAEIGPPKDLPFMALLEERARGEGFRLFRLRQEEAP